MLRQSHDRGLLISRSQHQYPEADRVGSLVLLNGLADIGADAAANLVREFVLKGITSHANKSNRPYGNRVACAERSSERKDQLRIDSSCRRPGAECASRQTRRAIEAGGAERSYRSSVVDVIESGQHQFHKL